MQKEIDDDITVWHKKVATANGISMADAKKLMSRKDRKEFQWTLEEYEQHTKADLLSGVTSANVMNASANWHLSYLDGMKLQLEHHVDKLYKNIDSKTRNYFKESLNENYLNTAFELQKGIGIGEKMEVPYDERKLENILRTPWASDGKNFSQRIWKDRTQLVNNLQKNLSESVIRGDSDTDMIQALSKDEKRAEFNTRRLVETESAYFDSLSEQECCEDFGIEKYRFLAVLDMKTSDICQELDNKVFLEKERQVGVNAPPMHPFCRSTTAPVIDEDFLTSRRAKNPKTGEYDEIPPDMNYKQWKEKYVEGKENAEEVKAETSTGTGSSGAEIKIESQKVEGGANKDTSIPQREEKFDSEVHNNRVEKQAEKLQELQNKQAEVKKLNKALLEEVENNKDNIPEGLVDKLKVVLKKNEDIVKDFGEDTNLIRLFEGTKAKLSNDNINVTSNLDVYTYFADKEYIKKDDFRNKCLKILSKNSYLCNGICDVARKIIERRDVFFDPIEEIHILNMWGIETAKAETNKDKLLKHKCNFNEEQKKKIEEHKRRGESYYAIHNHPTNSPPTLQDFIHLQEHGYTFGIVVCHNGDIYKYRRTSNTNYDESDWNKWFIDILKDMKFTKDFEKSWINIFAKKGLIIERF